MDEQRQMAAIDHRTARSSSGWPIVTCLLAGLLLSGCMWGDLEISADASYFAPRLDGDVALGPTSASSDVSLNSDLDLSDQDQVPYVHARAEAFGFALDASAFRTSQSGMGTMTADFGNITAGSSVTSDIDMTVGRFMGTFSLIDIGMFDLSLGVAVDYIDFDLKVKEPVFNLSEEISVQQPVPMLAVGSELDFPGIPLTVRADVAGIDGTFEEIDGFILDAELRLYWHVTKIFDVFAGYRLLHFDVDGNADGQDFSGNVDLSGFLVGLGVRF